MIREEWIEFLKNYYGHKFNISLDQNVKNRMRYQKEMGGKVLEFDKQLNVVRKELLNFESAIKNFVDRNLELLNSYLDLGFKIEEYEFSNYYGKCKRQRLVANMYGFEFDLMFHIQDSCHCIDGVDIIIKFPIIENVGGIWSAFDIVESKKQMKLISELVEDAYMYMGRGQKNG